MTLIRSSPAGGSFNRQHTLPADLSIDSISVFRGARDAATPVLDRVSLDVQRGKRVALLGSSGCVKTTLPRSITGFVALTSRRIVVDGRTIAHLAPEARKFVEFAASPETQAEGIVKKFNGHPGIGAQRVQSKLDKPSSDKLCTNIEPDTLQRHGPPFPLSDDFTDTVEGYDRVALSWLSVQSAFTATGSGLAIVLLTAAFCVAMALPAGCALARLKLPWRGHPAAVPAAAGHSQPADLRQHRPQVLRAAPERHGARRGPGACGAWPGARGLDCQ